MKNKPLNKIIAANIISGISLISLIVFGASYIYFKNTPIYSDYKIEITNNPINQHKDIDFSMSGIKQLSCTANNVYGLAVRKKDGLTVKLDNFLKMYTHNVTPGVVVSNTWTLENPGLEPGTYRVTMISEWTCIHWIFKDTTTRSHDSILLYVE